MISQSFEVCIQNLDKFIARCEDTYPALSYPRDVDTGPRTTSEP